MRTTRIVGFTIAAMYYLVSAGYAAPATTVMPHMVAIDQFHHWSDKELTDMTKVKGTTYLSDHEFFFIQELNRIKSGEPERHDFWNDYFVIQQGDGILAYGGTQVGGMDQGMGEWRGGKIEGSKTIALHAGDVAVIPAGMPHLITLQPGKNIRYLVFKARQ